MMPTTLTLYRQDINKSSEQYFSYIIVVVQLHVYKNFVNGKCRPYTSGAQKSDDCGHFVSNGNADKIYSW